MSNEGTGTTTMSTSLPRTHIQLSTGIQDTRILSEEDLSSKRKPPEDTESEEGSGKAYALRDYNLAREQELVAENIYLGGKINAELQRSRDGRATAMSTAEDWFKDFNRDVQENNNLAGYDDDPPYYIPGSSVRRKHHLPFKQHRPHKLSRISSSGAVLRGSRVRTGSSSKAPTSIADGNIGPGWGAQIESTSDSNSDSYRSVIDDLTIKNQKLKKRLKRLEELQAEHLQTDKLFEVRIHGLSVSKRQELEKLLQQFTSTLHAPPSTSSSIPTSASPPTSSGSPFGAQSIETFDSAYASGMGLQAGGTSSQPSVLSGKSGDTNSISSSDHSKPSAFHKKDSTTFTSEKAKMKAVVRRLEQLFTGRQPRGQHARSPQDVMRNSQMSDDPLPEEEGTREAPLMEVRPHTTTAGSPTDDSDLGSPSRPTTLPDVVDQRPTRPGDLDPRRPQIPEQNLEYLHNLTTSSAPAEMLQEDYWDGWVYLNLINNLAQLHTINVTLPFVKKAITTMSAKLELSPDGKMVRWKGGSEGSKLSSDSGSRSESVSTGSPIDSQSEVSRGRKRDTSISSLSDGAMGVSKLESLKFPISQECSTSRMSSSNSRSALGAGQRSRASHGSNDFHYKPLFAQEKSLDEDSSDIETTSTVSSDMKSSSSPDSGDMLGDRMRRSKKTTGPIIYYENGNFCTDLSTQELRGDNSTPEYPYERMTNEVVGAPSMDAESYRSRNLKLRSPLQTVLEGKSLGKRGESTGSEQDDEEDEGCVIDFSPTLDSTLPDHQLLPIELEASGIGGVQPEDNFAINVQMKHYILPKGNRHNQTVSPRKLKSKLRGIIHRIPQSSIDAFLQDENGNPSTKRSSGRPSQAQDSAPSPPHSTCSSSDGGPPSPPPLRHEVVSARFIRLPPSSLPPALFYSPSSDESSRDSDSGGKSSSSGSAGGSDYYMESQAGDDLTDDSQENMSDRGRKMHLGYGKSSTAGSSRLGGSVGSGKLVVGRERRSNSIPTQSSAATAGSRGDSIMGDQDSDDIMDDYGLGSGKSSDTDGQDNYQTLGDSDGASPKWARSMKHPADSSSAIRKIIPASQ